MRPRGLARLAPLALLPLTLIYLWPLVLHPNWVAYPPTSQYTDLLISHLPNALYWRESLAQYGQWPLWNGQIYGGLPFAADPLAGIWYPPNLLLLLMPLPLGFNLLLVVHVAWGGLGMLCFLRAERLSTPAAWLGAATFAGTPKLAAHLGAGHVTLVYAVTWTPWLLLAVRGAARQAGWTRGAVAGAALALVFLADVRWAFYAGTLSAAYWLVSSLPAVASGVPAAAPGTRGRILAVVAFAVFSVSIGSVLALPLAAISPLTSRSALTLADGATYSLPPLYFVGLLIPDLGGFHEWMTYLGIVPLLLALAGTGRRTWFWAAVAVVAAAFSLGTNFVLFPIVFRFLPGADLLRVPPRAWFLVALAAAVLAAYGLQRLADDWLPRLTRRYAAVSVRLPSALMVSAVLLVFTVLDLVRVDSTLIQMRQLPLRLPAATWLLQQPGLFRVYTPCYSLPYGDGLQHVDGIDPLQLTDAIHVIEPAIGVTASGYSVVIPNCAAMQAAGVTGAHPDAQRLALLDVKYVAADFDLATPGFALAQTFGQTHVYLNQAWTGRAWVEGQTRTAASVTSWSPNRIEVQATGPGHLVLSEIAYPGWQVRVDGQSAQSETADGALRAVEVTAGNHDVVFEFRPAPVTFGAALSGLSLLALGILLWSSRRH